MYDVDEVRSRFPALGTAAEARPAVYLDGPAGTQVPQTVIDAVSAAMVSSASNQGGPFAASSCTDTTVAESRAAVSDFIGGGPDEIVFGPNMTTLTFSLSRALAQGWKTGDRVVVTRLDHDANVTPWVLAARDTGAEVAFADIHLDDVSLDMESLASVVGERTRVVAVTGCSNTFGTLVDLQQVAEIAHSVGALCFVDAVHLAPHRRLDVARWGVDMLVCSAYKFYGPHVGILWSRSELLATTDAYKVRPAASDPPGKFETGTLAFANLAGARAAIEHLASLGEGTSRRMALDTAYEAIGRHERAIGERFLEGLPSSVRVWGRPTMDGRVSTFAVTVEGQSSGRVAEALGATGIFVWAGHNYAVEPVDRLGLMDGGGVVRLGFVHTSTSAEVDRALDALAAL